MNRPESLRQSAHSATAVVAARAATAPAQARSATRSAAVRAALLSPRAQTTLVTAAAISVAIASFLTLLAVPSFAGAAEPEARVITSESELLNGAGADGQLGDILLTNGDISVVIEAADHVNGEGLTGGNIVDVAVAPELMDVFGTHSTILGEYPRRAAYDTVYIESDGAGGQAVVAAEGVDSENPGLHVTTRYVLEADVPYFMIETTLVNETASRLDFTLGDALNWDYGDHFVPGYGFDVTDVTTFSAWLGSSSGELCYGHTVLSGTARSTHGMLWTDTIVKSGNLGESESITVDRYFIAGDRGLSSVSDVAHELRGDTVGTVSGTVTDSDTGEPVYNAMIECEVAGTSPYTEARSDSSGNFTATLFGGSYAFVATANHYLRTQLNGTVLANETTDIDFELIPGNWNPDIGDTLTYVMRPILAIPTILLPGDDLTIDALAPESTTGWTATLRLGGNETSLTVKSTEFDSEVQRWFIRARVPAGLPSDVYDLIVTADGGIYDEVRHSVAVENEMDDDFYFIHITDAHMPTHEYYYEHGAEMDTTELDDMRAVIQDVNLMNPAFVLFTGDIVNEGELEDFLEWRSFTKVKRILNEFDVPVYLTAGNHDVGGWNSTPPPDGTARRNWWRFFGWRYLYDPPPDDYMYTQNYTFDYGGVRFIGLEAYDNYDNWRPTYYGRESFTPKQMFWLQNQMAALEPGTPSVAFYHYEFRQDLDSWNLGLDCRLWGHTHRTWGQIETPPFNLSTRSLCDGNRTMRLVRVKGDTIKPREPFRAGSSGQNLMATYDAPNDGTTTRLSAIVNNTFEEGFNDGLVRFHVRADSVPYAATGGELLQTVVDGDVATCYVKVEIPAEGFVQAAVAPTEPAEETVAALLRQNVPNPTGTGTEISFVLPFATQVTLEVFDVAGRRVATLEEGPLSAGPHVAPWDLRNADGEAVATGVYFYRLEAGDETLTKKLVVVR